MQDINQQVHRVSIKLASWKRDWAIRKASKIILGAGGTTYPDWVSTDKWLLDVTCVRDFEKYWKPNTLTAFLAEHVWEHLGSRQRSEANENCFKFLKPGGWLRIAVPDGFHPDRDYIEYVQPGGTGLGADDHQVLFNYHSLSEELNSAGFQVMLLEYWNESGQFVANDWSVEEGYVSRSVRFDQRNRDGLLRYTSLIVDAKKTG